LAAKKSAQVPPPEKALSAETPRCRFCSRHLTSETHSTEHIIPKAIGGTLTSKAIVCKKCNLTFGKTIDVILARTFNPAMKALAAASTGKPLDAKLQSRLQRLLLAAKIGFENVLLRRAVCKLAVEATTHFVPEAVPLQKLVTFVQRGKPTPSLRVVCLATPTIEHHALFNAQHTFALSSEKKMLVAELTLFGAFRFRVPTALCLKPVEISYIEHLKIKHA
jgi:hypothetical protein